MTINDQTRDEKLRHNTDRKAANISSLSSKQFNKYEYVTGKEILPSNQKQMIEQGKFAYSPLGKAFQKQIKTIQNQGQVKIIEKYIYNDEDSPLISKQKEIFNKLVGLKT